LNPDSIPAWMGVAMLVLNVQEVFWKSEQLGCLLLHGQPDQADRDLEGREGGYAGQAGPARPGLSRTGL
jgi:hypothetical protein